MEKDISKKDLSEVKKKVLKSGLEEYLTSYDDEIKKLQGEERLNFKRTETTIRSFLEKSK